MKISTLPISGLLLIEPKTFPDERGYFLETYRSDIFIKSSGLKILFVQDNESKSKKGVLRGLHYQIPPYAQSKLVRVSCGSVLDVVLDLRKSSNTFGQHFSIVLSSENKYQLFVPHGFAHGYVVLSETAIFSYKVDNFYSPKHERGILFNDNQLNIDWHLPLEKLHLSKKDLAYPLFSKAIDLFD